MYFYDGCAFTGNHFQTVARYANGDPMAIIQNNIGIIGCHPEATPHWYDSYSWMRGNFVNKQHLLLEFVNKVFE